ncbi:hypothetical protein TVAG_375720 [Trichomonas vaginalis G3]|uniref:Uncharacterized protein n=1 Tax=Trichomonas vaginalis (strain ATCC PRA-98 / G3) TaxID=412133 RepID=A2FY48_TRIV3|nr:glycoprotein 38 family [Trichomonas vaginalis G3]EAX90181.1 hypothetical protein TVAG_375720 [Trichomonas vaginalis G3]KAI5505482.1 glycoprotein 38 family [Trichomonas vaginalis G3]|eukprot:XP_001303111.1 hypothetical protein [Trichomonas vaginalis G3]
MPNSTTLGRFMAHIEESKSSSIEASESLFEKDLLYEIPEGTKTQEELKEQPKESKIESNGTGNGPSRILIIGVAIAIIIIVIVVVCVLVWFFVFRKKSDEKESESGEKV